MKTYLGILISISLLASQSFATDQFSKAEQDLQLQKLDDGFYASSTNKFNGHFYDMKFSEYVNIAKILFDKNISKESIIDGKLTAVESFKPDYRVRAFMEINLKDRSSCKITTGVDAFAIYYNRDFGSILCVGSNYQIISHQEYNDSQLWKLKQKVDLTTFKGLVKVQFPVSD